VERLYRSSTMVMGALTLLIGLALVVTTIARGGGPLAVGFIVGVLFTLLGAGRLFLAVRSRPNSGQA
jgi:uncharacterized membrane protein HdeD (DUF308 family)